MKTPDLQTARLVVRLIASAEPSEMADFFRRNRDHLKATEPQRPDDFYTDEYWTERVEAARAEFASETSVRLYFGLRSDPSRVLGTVNFTQIFRGSFQACYLGYAADGQVLNQGYATEAIKAAIEYVFDEMNLHRIMANYLPENHASARVLAKLGFSIEGTAKNYLFINGSWRDHVLTSLTNDHWRGS